jgi:lipopolysaccharide export system permease protein
MFRILDRYLVREILLPFAIGLVVLTFVMMMPPILDQGQQLIEKGVDLVTFVRILLTITPSALCITIPMALLFAILMGLGRLSSDREFVAMQACGVSIFRALRPIAVLAVLAFAADQYVMLVALPNANQTFREITFNVVASKAETDVKPRTFYQGFDKRVVYARDVIPGGGGWRDVFLADSSRPEQTDVYFASRGRLAIDRDKRTVQLVLDKGTRHTTFLVRPEEYEPSSFERIILNMDADAVFRRVTLLKGDNEMTIPELRALAEQNKAHGQSNAMQLFTIQQKFSIPLSCLVLARSVWRWARATGRMERWRVSRSARRDFRLLRAAVYGPRRCQRWPPESDARAVAGEHPARSCRRGAGRLARRRIGRGCTHTNSPLARLVAEGIEPGRCGNRGLESCSSCGFPKSTCRGRHCSTCTWRGATCRSSCWRSCR